MSVQKFDLFFELPGELREQILAQLVIKPAGIHIGERYCFSDRAAEMSDDVETSDDGDDNEDEYDDSNTKRRARWPVNYFLVSQTFYNEASRMFFGSNVFHLYAGIRRSTLFDTRSKQSVMVPLQQSSRRKGLAACGSGENYLQSRRRVRHLVLYIQRLGGSFGSIMAPCLQDMILVGDLRYLDIRVYHLEQQGADKRGALWTSTPAAELLRLLRDPDLESAKLRAHLPVQSPERVRAMGSWCTLHTEQEAGGHESRTAQWASIDVDELIRRYGGVKNSIQRAVEERSLLTWAGSR